MKGSHPRFNDFLEDHFVASAIPRVPYEIDSRLAEARFLVVPSQSFPSPDILTYPSVFGNRLARLTNNGSGGFDSMTAIGKVLPGLPVALLGGSFADPDGVDVAVVSSDYSGMLSDGTRSWVRVLRDSGSTMVSEEELPFAVVQAASGDVNGDELDDLVLRGRVTGGFSYGDSVWLLTRSAGGLTFDAPVEIPQAEGTSGPMLVMDFTGDGLADLVTCSPNEGGLQFHETVSSPSLGSYQEWAFQNNASADGSGDQDLDGASDLEEFLSGRNPRSMESSRTGQPGAVPLMRFDPASAGSLHLSFEHPRPRLIDGGTAAVALEFSEDMETWAPVEASARVRLAKDHPGWEIWSWQFNESVDQGVGRKFFRFRTSIM